MNPSSTSFRVHLSQFNSHHHHTIHPLTLKIILKNHLIKESHKQLIKQCNFHKLDTKIHHKRFIWKFLLEKRREFLVKQVPFLFPYLYKKVFSSFFQKTALAALLASELSRKEKEGGTPSQRRNK